MMDKRKKMKYVFVSIFFILNSVLIFAMDADSIPVVKSVPTHDSTKTSTAANKINKPKSDTIPRFCFNIGGTFGPETLIGPEASLDYYPFNECSVYLGIQLGWQFPAATLAGNIGLHAGYKIGIVFFETSFTAYTQASTMDASWSEHYTTNFKIGVTAFGWYFKSMHPI